MADAADLLERHASGSLALPAPDPARPAELPAIRIEVARKRYGGFLALDDVSLDVFPGEFITLLGPSGSGKTTLLNIIAGFQAPDRGIVSFGDRDVTALPPNRRDLGMVFQSYALFPHMTVGENIAFPLRVRRLPRAEILRRVAEVLEMVRLDGFAERSVAALSGGQRQRVALARAVVFSPRIVLMDEPLSALDKNLREHMQVEIRHLHRRIGATTLYVTHDQREALTMSDRVAIMNRGRIVQLDTPRAIYDRPANAFVAGFLGETSLIPVTPDGATLRLADGSALAWAGDAIRGEHMVVARSERVLLPGEFPPDAWRLPARLEDAIFQGESILLLFRLSNGLPVSVRRSLLGSASPPLPDAGAPTEIGLVPAMTPVVPVVP
ncbi:ABC transporter ATP-binding protein (plasmid) [Roseomonas sp. CCTCC AB2023176]|uniref:ABC transporter ATP-binding protein n=1 Tax=Roseomonas sp. CCTCC AB2023176 TaxID=3342640 RepID=UPI0035D5803C